MNRETIIKKTIKNLSKLPDSRLEEVSLFTEFLVDKIEDEVLTAGIMKIASDAKALHYVEEDDCVYTVEDLKERYK